MRTELRDNILPFWLRLEDPLHGGHFAGMDLAGRIDRRAPKSTVFVSRLLWTLSSVTGVFEREVCLAQAAHTRRFLLDRLRDAQDGAFFWSATREGRPLQTDKHLYAQAFAIYALSAHARATGDEESLAAAKDLFALIEARAREKGAGYGEAFDSRWRPIDNSRLGCRVIGARTSNSHLHLIEAYTGLLRA
jgi:mannobiose 2-epimerase